jgi:hypothetical protein
MTRLSLLPTPKCGILNVLRPKNIQTNDLRLLFIRDIRASRENPSGFVREKAPGFAAGNDPYFWSSELRWVIWQVFASGAELSSRMGTGDER